LFLLFYVILSISTTFTHLHPSYSSFLFWLDHHDAYYYPTYYLSISYIPTYIYQSSYYIIIYFILFIRIFGFASVCLSIRAAAFTLAFFSVYTSSSWCTFFIFLYMLHNQPRSNGLPFIPSSQFMLQDTIGIQAVAILFIILFYSSSSRGGACYIHDIRQVTEVLLYCTVVGRGR